MQFKRLFFCVAHLFRWYGIRLKVTYVHEVTNLGIQAKWSLGRKRLIRASLSIGVLRLLSLDKEIFYCWEKHCSATSYLKANGEWWSEREGPGWRAATGTILISNQIQKQPLILLQLLKWSLDRWAQYWGAPPRILSNLLLNLIL